MNDYTEHLPARYVARYLYLQGQLSGYRTTEHDYVEDEMRSLLVKMSDQERAALQVVLDCYGDPLIGPKEEFVWTDDD